MISVHGDVINPADGSTLVANPITTVSRVNEHGEPDIFDFWKIEVMCTHCEEVMLLYTKVDTRSCMHCHWCSDKHRLNDFNRHKVACNLAPYVYYCRTHGHCAEINRPEQQLDSRLRCVMCKHCTPIVSDRELATYRERDLFYLKHDKEPIKYNTDTKFGCTLFEAQVTDVPEVCQMFEYSKEKFALYKQLCIEAGNLFCDVWDPLDIN